MYYTLSKILKTFFCYVQVILNSAGANNLSLSISGSKKVSAIQECMIDANVIETSLVLYIEKYLIGEILSPSGFI